MTSAPTRMPRQGPPPWSMWPEVCSSCGRTWSLADLRWECRCGGLLDLVGPLADACPFGSGETGAPGGAGAREEAGGPGQVLAPGPRSPLARYAAALPPGSASADLGMSITPLAEVGPGVFVKAEYEQPTGSFKDRGAAVMIGVAAGLGVRSLVVDSSGNAGKAAAAHAARAGLECTVYVPAGTSPTKLAAIAGYGATVVEVPGGRSAAATAAQNDVREHGRWYASHVHQPLFHHGVKTLAFELFEQMPGIAAGRILVPAGNGTLVLGLWLGFGELVALGRLRRRPALVAVQAERCAPLAGLPAPAAGGPNGTAAATSAAGIAVTAPPRARQIRAAVLASGGRVVTVSEEAIAAAMVELSQLGHRVEPTGAVAWAALRNGVGDGGPTAAVLTGR